MIRKTTGLKIISIALDLREFDISWINTLFELKRAQRACTVTYIKK